MKSDMAFRLSDSLKLASDSARQMKQAGDKLIHVAQSSLPEARETIEVMERALSDMKLRLSETEAAVFDQMEMIEDYPKLQQTVDNAATIARNFRDVFVRSDPETIASFLKIAERESRQVAATGLSESEIQAWIEDLEAAKAARGGKE